MRVGVSVINKNKTTNLIDFKTKHPIIQRFIDKAKIISEELKLRNEITHMQNKWVCLMADAGVNNSEMKTYTLADMQQERYGWSCKIFAPFNLPLENLDQLRPAIEGTFFCKFMFKIQDDNRYAEAKFIFRTDGNKIDFRPYKVNPWELYMGVDASCDPIVFDQNIDCHVLVVGNTRKGKSVAIHHALVSLICNCSEDDIEIILIQLLKDDLGIYENCKQILCFCDTLEKAQEALRYAVGQITDKTNIMKPLKRKGKAGNIMDYNANNPDKKMKRTLVVIDEWGALIPESFDSQEVKDMKNACAGYLCSISQAGASVGVTYIIGEQRPTADRLPSFLKNNSNVRVAFGVSTKKGAEVVMDNEMALNLPPRRAVYLCNGEYNMLYTTKLTDSMIYKFIKPHFKPYRPTLFDKVNMPDVQHHAEYSDQQRVDIPGEEPTPVIEYVKKKTRRGKKKL